MAPIVAAMDAALDAARPLLDDLLDLSRLEAGAVKVAARDLAIGELLTGIAAEFAIRARERGLRLAVAPCSAVVHSDPALLRRIIRNLVDNALHYTGQGTVLVGCRRRGATLEVIVADTGIGVPEDQQDAIFEEFYRVSDGHAGAPQEGGGRVGLGLAIVRSLCRLLGHEVRVTSTPGRGSRFMVSIPVVRPFSRRPARPALVPPAGSGRRILVIDDEAMIREALRLVLEGWDHQVETARDLEEALACIGRGFRPDLVLVDYLLKDGATGIEALAALRDAAGLDLPAAILTGDTARRPPAGGANDVSILYKPVWPDELRRLVDGLAARHRPSGLAA